MTDAPPCCCSRCCCASCELAVQGDGAPAEGMLPGVPRALAGSSSSNSSSSAQVTVFLRLSARADRSDPGSAFVGRNTQQVSQKRRVEERGSKRRQRRQGLPATLDGTSLALQSELACFALDDALPKRLILLHSESEDLRCYEARAALSSCVFDKRARWVAAEATK